MGPPVQHPSQSLSIRQGRSLPKKKTPKKKTAQLIASIEGTDRGYYTGIAGYFDGVNLDSCVLIRYLAADNVYHSGGGITFQSDMASEYQEMINKVYVPVF
jgi:para-aminobenzoate synthetase component 1